MCMFVIDYQKKIDDCKQKIELIKLEVVVDEEIDNF